MTLPERLLESSDIVRRHGIIEPFRVARLLAEAAQALTDLPKPKAPLTSKQYDLLAYIKEYIVTHGYAPKFEEIRNQFQLKALATVYEHLTNLERKGHIARRRGEGRSIIILP